MEMKYSDLIQALADGIDFRSGEAFPPDHILHEPHVIRALCAASAALKDEHTKASTTSTPARNGDSWDEEDELLKEGFQRGLSVADLAVAHQRTHGGIMSRLKRLSLITP